MPESSLSPEHGEEQFTVKEPRGALFHTIHAERTSMIYPMLESELKTISLYNTLAVMFFSVGTGLATFAVGLLADAILEAQLTDYGKVLVKVVVPLCAMLALGCYGIAIWAIRNRRSELDRIRGEATED